MSSPFEVFRRHQIMTVILIGLAMLAFVIFGAIPDPREIPPALWILAFAAIIGGVMWVLGLKEKKQNEWGITGALAGMAIAAAFSYANRPATAVEIAGGGLTEEQIQQKQYELGMANAFLERVFAASSEGRMQMPNTYLVDLGRSRVVPNPQRFAIQWELLGREADRLGIDVSNEAVNTYLEDMTSGRVRRNHIKQAREQLNISEPQIYRILRDSISRRTVMFQLFSSFELPPQQYFDFYERLNDARDLQVITLPVEEFAKSVEEPNDQELMALFNLYRGNRPNFTADGRFVGGLPGFYQENRVKLAYVEFPFEEIKETIAKPTDEEIQAEYDARYKRQLENPFDNAPELPSPDGSQATPPADDQKPEMKEEDTAKPAESEAPAAAKPSEESAEKPAAPKAEGEKPAEPAGEEPKPAAEKPTEEKPEENSSEPAAGDGKETSAVMRSSKLVPVAFFQDEPEKAGEEKPATDEKPATEEKPASEEKPAPKEEASKEEPAKPADKPKEETPKPEPAKEEMKKEPAAEPAGDSKPAAEDKPADEAKPEANAKPADSKPEDAKPAGDETVMELKTDGEPAKKSEEPPKLEDVREEIINDLIEAKAMNKQQELVQSAMSKMLSLESQRALGDLEDSGLTLPQIAEKLKAWAEENGGVYGETPLMSYEELSESDDYPIGKAFSGREGTVAGVAIQTPDGAVLNAREAIDFETRSGFAWWVVDSLAPHVPQSLDEAGVREEVVEAAKMQKALPKAEERANELASKIREAGDEDLSKMFGETTLTGAEGADYITVKSTGPITWMSQDRLQTNPMMGSQATLTDLRAKLGLEQPVGNDFMKLAFRSLGEGEVGVATNVDKSAVLVVRVVPGDTAEDGPAEEFLKAPLFQPSFISPYPGLAGQERQTYQPDALADLERKYGVEFN